MISNEKEVLFSDWLGDHKIFIWTEIKSDLSDLMTERQIRYQINKLIRNGFIIRNNDEYRVVGNLEQLRREMEETPTTETKPDPLEIDSEKPEIPNPEVEIPTPKKEEPVVKEKEEELKEPEKKIPDIIAQKAKKIELAQTRKKIQIKKPIPTPASKPAEPKGFVSKYWIVITVGILAVLAAAAYFLLGRKPPAAPVTQKSELDSMGFVNAENYFRA